MRDTVKVVCTFCHGAKEADGKTPVDCEACHEFGWWMYELAPGQRERIAREVVAERVEKMTEEDLFDMSESMEYATTKFNDREQVAALRRRIIRSFLKPPDAKTEEGT